MSIDALDVALAGIALTALSIVIGYVDRRADRRNARQLAHDERLSIRRADLYVDLLEYAYRTVAHVDHYNVSQGKVAPSEDEARQLQARLAAEGSPEVAAAAEDVIRQSLALYVMATMERPKPDAADEGSYHRKLDMTRAELMERVRALEARVSTELTRLPKAGA